MNYNCFSYVSLGARQRFNGNSLRSFRVFYGLLRREIWFSKKEFKNILLGFSVSSILRLLHSCSIVRSTIKSWLSFLFTHSFIFHIGWCYFLEHFLQHLFSSTMLLWIEKNGGKLYFLFFFFKNRNRMDICKHFI
jgi:hypothetical protein